MKRPHIDRIAGWYAIATQVLTLALVLVLGAHAQTNQTSFPAQSFTATSQTGAVINLTGGFALGTIEVYGTITTVSWELQGTNDGGLHWFLMQTNPITNPSGQATSQTASAATMYAASLSGLTNIKITTLGTFTGTGVYFKVTATPLGYLGSSSSGGGILSITSPNGTVNVGGTSADTTLDVAASLSTVNVNATTALTSNPHPIAINLIFDDDNTGDVDTEVNALPNLFNWENTAGANVLALIADGPNAYSAPLLNLMAKYYGRTIPVGANQTSLPAGVTSPFTSQTIAQFCPASGLCPSGDTRANYPACVTTITNALSPSSVAENSVDYVETGYMTCLAAAMVDSTANALLKSKISALDIMGGVYPSGTEYNFQTDPADAAYVMTHWTVQNGYPPMYLNGYGNGASVTSGIPTWFPPATLTTYVAGDNPGVYAGLEAGSLSRASFDVLSLCHAILGNTGCGFTVSASGTNTVNATSGANSWSSSTASGQYVITTSQTAAFYEEIFDGQSYNGGAAQYPLTLPGTIAADGSIQTNSVYPTYIPHAYLGACVGPGCTGSGTVTTSGTPSTNSLSKFCGSTVICNSSITDDGTTVGLAERLNQTIQTSTPNILLSPVEIPELILVPTGAGAWLRFWNLAISPTSEAWLGLCALPGGSGDDICVGNVANYGVTANQPFWAGYFGVPITGVFGFGAQAVYAGTGALDSGFSRLAPGAMAVGNGTQGDKTGTLQAGVTPTDPGCTTTAHIGKQWFNTTTTTTVYQVCLDVAGTVGWVVK